MAEKPSITRRLLFGVGASLALVTVPGIAAAQDAEWDRLERDVDALLADEVAGVQYQTEEAYDRYVMRMRRVLDAVEARPATDMHGLRVKAKAFKFCHYDEFDTAGGEMLNEQDTTDCRFAVQIVRALLEMA